MIHQEWRKEAKTRKDDEMMKLFLISFYGLIDLTGFLSRTCYKTHCLPTRPMKRRLVLFVTFL